uniref:Uncharacterized protein n=1 Tax=Globodera rostochiensis TaxID=31243 RepID=A0A914GRL4_GLORO
MPRGHKLTTNYDWHTQTAVIGTAQEVPRGWVRWTAQPEGMGSMDGTARGDGFDGRHSPRGWVRWTAQPEGMSRLMRIVSYKMVMGSTKGSSPSVPDPSSPSRASILACNARRATSLRAWSSPARVRRAVASRTDAIGG